MIYDIETTETFQYPGVRFLNTGDKKNALNNSSQELHKHSKSFNLVRVALKTCCFHIKFNCF